MLNAHQPIHQSTLRPRSSSVDQYRALQSAITEIIASGFDVDQAISQVIQSICLHTDWDFGEAWDYDDTGQTLVYRAQWAPVSTHFPKFQEISRRIAFSPGIGLPWRVWKSVQPLWIPDVVEDTGFLRASFAAREGLHTGVGLPLYSHEKVIGVMSFFSRTLRPPDRELLELFDMIGRHIGLFIEHRLLNALEREQIREEAAMQERLRIAQNIHSLTVGALFPAAITAETMPYLWESDHNKLWYTLNTFRQTIQQALAESQQLLIQLQPKPTTEAGIRQLLAPLVESYTTQTHTKITFTTHGDSALTARLQVAVYCIAQEALQNIMQHARATTITISLSSHEFGGELAISDNGKGFEPGKVLPDRLGLRIMRGCAEGIAGTLEIVTALNQGTKVMLSWRNSR